MLGIFLHHVCRGSLALPLHAQLALCSANSLAPQLQHSSVIPDGQGMLSNGWCFRHDGGEALR